MYAELIGNYKKYGIKSLYDNKLTWANQIKILKQNFQQLSVIIGKTFIQALKPLVKAVNQAMASILNFATTVYNALGKIFGWKFEPSGGGGTTMTDDMVGAEDASGGIADNLGEASNNAKKLKSHLLAIDELNVYEPTDDTDTSTGGGGGTATGGAGDIGQFVKTGESIFEEFKSEIDSLYELGTYIRDALIGAMESIDWESVYEKARNFGKGLAEFLNGLFATDADGKTLFGELGRTIASALNAVIYSALEFALEFDWEQFGYNLADGINNFFYTFDFGSLAQAINKWVQGIWTTITSAISNIKWENVWKGVFDFLKNIELKTVALILGAVTIKKIAKLHLAKNILALIGTEISKNLGQAIASKLGVEIAKDAGISAALKTGFSKLFANFTKYLPSILGSVATITSVFAEFFLIKDAFYDLSRGADNFDASLTKICVGLGVATVALKLFGLSNPFTALIVGATAIASAIMGVKKATDELAKNTLFETLSTKGTVLMEDLGNVAIESFGNITEGAEKTREKLDEISNSRESIIKTSESIYFLREAIDNGAYTASEKVPEIIEQFNQLLNDSKEIFDEEYRVIVGNVVGAWADTLEAQGKSVPEIVAGFASLREETITAYGDVETSLRELEEQYINGAISADEFYKKSIPLYEKLSSFGSSGEIDGSISAIKDFGGSLDLSQYIQDGVLDMTAFSNAMNDVVGVAKTGKDNLTAIGEEQESEIQAFRERMESLGLDTSKIDWAALYGANEQQVSQGISDIDSAYTEYANKVQYHLLEQLPQIVDEATKEYENLKWYEKLFTTKEDFVQTQLDKWEKDIVEPITSEIGTSFENLGIDGEAFASEAAEKMTDSLFDTITLRHRDGVESTQVQLRSDWETALSNALDGVADVVNAESYGETIGSNITKGIYAGIDSESPDETSQSLLEKITSSIETAFGIHSPAESMKPLGEYIFLGILEGFKSKFEDFTTAITEFYETYILPWFTLETWYLLAQGIVDGIALKWEEFKLWWSETALVTWWTENVEPWFTLEKWQTLADSIKTGITNKWTEMTTLWKTNIKKWWDEHVAPWFTLEKWQTMLQTIPTAFKEAFKKGANGAIGFLNKVISGVEDLVNSVIDAFNDMVEKISGLASMAGIDISFSASHISLPRIPTFESGGYPSVGSLFFAGEYGVPELLGTVGGKTAVAGGAEITGIKDEIYALRQEQTETQNMVISLLQVIAQKEMSVILEGRETVNFIRESESRMGYNFQPT